MTRTEIEFTTRCKSISTALARFSKNYPASFEVWGEEIEWMLEAGCEFESDERLADGSKQAWTWALHAYHEDDCFYIAVIERH